MICLDAALKKLESGKPVFSVDRSSKRPLVEWKPYQNRVPTKQEVTGWWAQWPDANIGMATGHLSGVVIIDCDSEEAANRFIEEYPEAKDTLQVQTGRGKHFYFKFEEGIRNDAGKLLGSGIDVRGEGGYVVIPPSIHANGKTYLWLNKNKPIALPDKLRKILVSRSKDGEKPNGGTYRERFNTSQALAGVPEGQRDETLFRLACKLRNADVPQGMAETLILEAARNCQPPFSESIALEKVGRVYKQYQPGANPSDPNSFPHYREKTVRKEIKLQTWEEFLSSTPEEREYSIDGFLPESGLAVLLGRGKHGKSTLVTHACRAVGSGKGFLGRETKKRPVVYVNYEMAEDYLQTLIRAGDCPTGAYIINRPEPILTLKTIEKIMGQVENGPGMMVIDSFRGAFKLQGEAENLSGGAGVILRRLQDLAINTGWLIIVIHHSNRGSKEGTDSVSGTSDWIAAPDVLWSWSRPDPDKSGTLIIEGRIPPVEPMAVKLTLEECSFVGTVKEDQEQTDKQEIIAALSDEGQTSEEIARAIGKPPGTTRTRLDSLYREGLVGREGVGRRGKPYKWITIDSAQDNPLSAETKFEEPNEEKDKWQTLDL